MYTIAKIGYYEKIFAATSAGEIQYGFKTYVKNLKILFENEGNLYYLLTTVQVHYRCATETYNWCPLIGEYLPVYFHTHTVADAPGNLHENPPYSVKFDFWDEKFCQIIII